MGFLKHSDILRENAKNKAQLAFQISEDGLRTIIGKLREIGISQDDCLAVILNTLHKVNRPKN